MLKMLGVGAVLGIAGVLATALLGRPLLRLAYTAEYTQYLDVLVWLAVAAAIGLVGSAVG